MNIAVNKAKEIYQKYGSNPEEVATELGLDIIEVSMEGEAKEFYWGDAITLKEGLPEELKREYIAHAICHHLLHAGSRYPSASRRYSFDNYHERQANVFAAYLLIPDDKLEKEAHGEATVYELAEKFQVTPSFAKWRLGLAKHYTYKKFKHV